MQTGLLHIILLIMKRIISALAFLAIVISCHSETNVINESFDNSSDGALPAGFTTENASVEFATEGDRTYLKMTPTVNARLKYTLDAPEVGKVYTMTATVRTNPAKWKCLNIWTSGGVNLGDSPTDWGNDWTTHSYSVTVTPAMTYLIFSAFTSAKAADGTTLDVDNFTVTVKDAPAPEGRTYYIDDVNGNDANSGRSKDLAWQSLAKVNAAKFEPGDSVLFVAGGEWIGQLELTAAGTENFPIVYTSYGDGGKPQIIGGGGKYYTVSLSNTPYTEFSNFEVTNYGNTSMAGRCGILMQAASGDIPNLVVKNNDVHSVNGEVDKNKQDNSKAGAGAGIYWSNKGSNAGRLVDALIQGNHVYNCQRNGICGAGNQTVRHLRLKIRQNVIEDIPGDAIVLNTCENSVAEYNIARDFTYPNPMPDSGTEMNYAAGIWPWNSNNSIIQFNEVSGHTAPGDGQGYDSDFWCDGTIIQYNYSHDNGGGFLLVCGNKDRSEDGESSPTTNTVVRYNISINDGGRTWGAHANDFPIVYFHGHPEGTQIYNNTFYFGDKRQELNGNKPHIIKAVWGEPWSTSIYNNIFASLIPGAVIDMQSNKNTVLDNNLYYNVPTKKDNNGPLVDNNQLVGDPKFIDMRGDTPGHFQLQPGSPALGTGKLVSDNGGRDFFGNPVSNTDNPNIGAYNGTGTNDPTSIDDVAVAADPFMIMPNITKARIKVKIQKPLTNARLTITTLTGKVVKSEHFSSLNECVKHYDVSSYREGVYIFTIDSPSLQMSKRFIKL